VGFPDFLNEGLALAAHKRNQWKSPGGIADLQGVELQKLAAHAFERVPFYKKRFRESNLRSMRSLEDLQSLPITTKDDVRRHADAMICAGLPKDSLYRFSTTGTTGSPTVHYMDRSDAVRGAALRQFSFMECGFAPGDILANLAFSQMPRFPMQPLLYRVKSIHPAEDLDKSYLALKAAAPSIVFAYPSVLAIMADMNIRSATPLHFSKAVSVSEMMRPGARKLIQDSFGCTIRNYYGSSECWAMAWECEKGSLHINSDSAILEAVDEAGRPVRDGQSGDLLMTLLWRYAMPFIRYKIGDRGRLGSCCPCGRGLQVLKSLEGRTTDYITLPSGKRFPWMFTETPFGQTDGIVSYQVVQETRGSLHMKLIVAPGSPPGIGGVVKSRLLSYLPEKMDVHVEIVERIERSGRGKVRDFISKIKAPD
jgi:phenylacetate-CoA ligase